MGFDRNLNRWSEKSLEEAAAEEFGESPAILTSSLLSVKTWISQCPHLKQACTEDLFLTTFLRGCKFSLERTKEKLDNFHAIKTSLPEWFDNWDPKDPAVQEILSAGIFLPLPGFDREGRLVTLSRSGKVVPSKMKLDDLIRTSLMVMAVARAGEQQSVIRGLVQVQDMEGLGAHHLSLFNIPTIKKLIKMGESAWPLRPKMAHILNRPSLVDTVADLVKGLQKEKMQRRQVVHPQGDYSGLVEDLGKDILPVEYGGTNGSVEDLAQFWKKEVEASAEWLTTQTKYKSEENLRRGSPKLHADLFGIEGSFRKLDID